MGNFECGLRRVQVHHPHHSAEEVAGGVQHDASERGYPRRVADEEKGNISVEVKADDWGQDDHCDGGLEKFEPRYGSDELDVWEAVDQSVFVLGQVRVLGQRFCSGQGASVGSLQGG